MRPRCRKRSLLKKPLKEKKKESRLPCGHGVRSFIVTGKRGIQEEGRCCECNAHIYTLEDRWGLAFMVFTPEEIQKREDDRVARLPFHGEGVMPWENR